MSNPKEAIIRRYYEELFNRGRLELVSELLAPDYVNHSPGSPEQARGRDGVVEVVRALRLAFPDLQYIVEDLVVGEHSVAARTTMTGTHRGDFFGLPPTGKRFQVSQMAIERFRGEAIVAHHRVTDELSLFKQLGVVP